MVLEKNIFELKENQKGIFFDCQVEKNPHYNISAAYSIKKSIDVPLFEEAILILINKHSVLRTYFEVRNDVPVQIIVPEVDFKMNFTDISGLNQVEKKRKIREILSNNHLDQFDLKKAPLFRINLVKRRAEEYLLFICFHHIITDGWSLEIFKKDLLETYLKLKNNNRDIKMNIDKDFIDFVLDENYKLKSGKYESKREYWINKLRNAHPINLYTDYPLKQATIDKGEKKQSQFRIANKIYKDLKEVSINNGTTMYMFLMAVFKLLLHKYTGETDITVSSPFTNRPLDKYQDVMGYFVNMLPLRDTILPDMIFRDFLRQVKNTVIDTYENVEYPNNLIFRKINGSDNSGIALTDIAFVFDVYEKEGEELEEILNMSLIEQEYINSPTIFEISFQDDGEKLSGKIIYNSALFQESTIKRMIAWFFNLLNQIIKNINSPIYDLSLITNKEREIILMEFNDTKREYPDDKTIHQIFEEQVEKIPDKVAVICEDKILTYHELNQKSNQLARVLRDKGVGPDTIVGIILDKSLDLMIGILAILKAGGAYMPIDPDYPLNRIRYMLEDTKTGIILTEEKYRVISTNISTQENIEILTLDLTELSRKDSTNLEKLSKQNNLAYIIYTSGSTGRPKGVMVEHRSVNRLVKNTNYIEFHENDRILQTGAISFDASTFEIWAALLNGLQLYLMENDIFLDIIKLKEEIKKNNITILWLTSPLFNHIAEKDAEIFTGLKYLLVGGDVLNATFINKVKNKCRGINIINGYGPTENTTFSTTFLIDRFYEKNIPIGKPINNSRAYILDTYNNLKAIGVSGELCVAGDGIARGYLNKPDLTAEKFIDDPFAAGKLYKTGDLARWLPDGNIEFLGRIDHQAKIRGFRIETEEIEYYLLKHKDIKKAVVLAKEDGVDKHLAAYIVTKKEIPISELRDFLLKELPEYMVPTYFISLDKMPLTLNGKIDRKSLLAMEVEIETEEQYLASTNETEKKLLKIWEDVLGVRKVGIKDNFFDLGGHSLNAISLVSRIHKELQVEVPLKEVFRLQNVKSIAEYIINTEKSRYFSIAKAKKQERYPVSSAQKRLFVLNQIGQTELSYNMPGIMEIEGKLKIKKLVNAFESLIKRHEALRTSFEFVEGEPCQKIHAFEELNFELEFIDKKESEKEIGDIKISGNKGKLDSIIESFVKPFDLSQAPLLRACLIEKGKNEYILLFDMHHIISDGMSMNILLQNLLALYQGLHLGELQIQYRDFAVWQNQMFSTDVIKKQENYWIDKFKGEIPVLDLPIDFKRPREQNFEGDILSFEIEKTVFLKLKDICKETETTLYMLLMAVYNILLSKYTMQQDIIIGFPISGRRHNDLDNLIGMFVNTLAIRNFPEGEKRFKEFLEEIKENTLAAYENQDYPFEELLEKLEIKRDLSRNPLFDTMFSIQQADSQMIKLDDLELRTLEVNPGISKFDLSLEAVELEDKLILKLEYASRLFKRETIERLSKHFTNIIKKIINNIDIKISDIELITPDEKEEILVQFNNTYLNYSQEKTIKQLFEEQAAETPEDIALVSDTMTMTYRELNRKSNQLAHFLRQKGIGPDKIVGIMVERSIEMIIGIFAILKAGGAYLPLDINYPDKRLEYILEDSNAEILLVKNKFKDRKIKYQGSIINFSSSLLYLENQSNLLDIVTPHNLAYIIYTSGTTGNPKGVMVEHKNVLNYCAAFENVIDLPAQMNVLQQASFSFDTFVEEVFPTLLKGGRLILLPQDQIIDINILESKIRDENINIITSSPLFLNELNKLPNIPVVDIYISGGDVLKKEYISKIAKNGQVYNSYGPTETTVCATYYKYHNDSGNSIPIGKPIANYKVYILDKNNRLQPIGIPGEMCIAGEGLARGYLNRPGLTAKKFVDNPYEKGKIYKTGDMAKWLPDGNVEFLGRIDTQAKIRGFRVETGEIENLLLKNEHIKEVTVLVKGSGSERYLAAYFVSGQDLSISELRDYLSNELPDYMIPAYFLQIEKMPLTPNGKIDTKALSEISTQIDRGIEYIPPSNYIEKKLVDIWEEVLGIDKIGINDNFYEFGGDSIKAIQVSSRLYNHDMKLDIKYILSSPRIKDLSKFVQITSRKKISNQLIEGEVELTPIQKWFFEKEFVEKEYWNQAVMLYRKDGFNEERLKKVFKRLVSHHDALRMRYYLKKDNSKIIQYNRAIGENTFSIETLDLKSQQDITSIIEEESNKLQFSFDLEDGRLLKIVQFKTNSGDHLLISIHHLIVDAVSWRILLEDFFSGYMQLEEKEEITFPPKTDSYQEWSSSLKEYAHSKEVLSQIDYWEDIIAKQEELPVDNKIASRIVGNCTNKKLVLSRERTEQLLNEVSSAYNTKVNDILLSALGLAINKWCGLENIVLNMEGHGRDKIIEDIDITRTVGWFTTQYPLLLKITNTANISFLIKNVKESLRKVPCNGVGYQMLKYLSDIGIGDYREEISFNYLGHLDSQQNVGGITISELSAGNMIGPGNEQPYKIDLNGYIIKKQLIFEITYDINEFKEGNIEKLCDLYKDSLEEIIEHCLNKEQGEYTPSDFSNSKLSFEELEEITNTNFS